MWQKQEKVQQLNITSATKKEFTNRRNGGCLLVSRGSNEVNQTDKFHR